MYVLQSRGCDQPNSETPMSPAAIARQDRFVANVGRSFDSGNAALSDLISALGGNASTVAVGDAGVPAGVISPGVPYVSHGTRVVRLPGWPGRWPVGGLFTGKNFAWPTAGGLMSPSSGFPATPATPADSTPALTTPQEIATYNFLRSIGVPQDSAAWRAKAGGGFPWPGSPGSGSGPGARPGGGGAAPVGSPGSVFGGWPANAGPRPGAFPNGPLTGPGGNFPTVFSAGPGGWPASIAAGGAGLLPSSFPCPGVASPGGGAGAAVVAGDGSGDGTGDGSTAAARASAWWALLLLLGAAMFVDGASKKDGGRA